MARTDDEKWQKRVNWGVVATTDAPLSEILDFASHHLDLGASRIWVFLDDPDRETAETLRAHPKLRVVETDSAYWDKKGERPVAHQARQTVNVRHAYRRSRDLGWIAHIDTDEFIWPEAQVASVLGGLPSDCGVARMRPKEALAPDPQAPVAGQAFKAFHLDRRSRAEAADRLYPEYALHLNGGFLGHVAGKVFVRTRLEGVKIRIHQAVGPGGQDLGQHELETIALLHFHAASWAHWRARFDYRLARGAYRPDLARAPGGGLTMHQFFSAILETEGEPGLARFFRMVGTATPGHLAALEREGLLHVHDLELSRKRKQYFPWAKD